MLHRYWTGASLPDTEPWVGWVIEKMHPDLMLHDWTDDHLSDEIVGWLDGAAVQVKEEDRPRHRANMVRWWLLREYGGIWLDYDIIPLAPLPVDRRMCATPGSLPSSCVIGLPAPNDPLADKMLTAIQGAGPQSDRPSVEVSGDKQLMRVAQHEGLHLLPMRFGLHGDVANATSPLLHLWRTSSKRA